MAPKEEKELWIEFAQSAMSVYGRPEDNVETTDELIDDAVDFSAGYADAMLDEIDERFGNEKRSTRRRKARKDDEE